MLWIKEEMSYEEEKIGLCLICCFGNHYDYFIFAFNQYDEVEYDVLK